MRQAGRKAGTEDEGRVEKGRQWRGSREEYREAGREVGGRADRNQGRKELRQGSGRAVMKVYSLFDLKTKDLVAMQTCNVS